MERTNSNTIRVLEITTGGPDRPSGLRSDDTWASFQKDNGRIVKIALWPTFKGICLAAGFVGTGGRHIN